MHLPKIVQSNTLSFANPKGFSLIEILVVISIIGILSGLAINFSQAIQRSTRDARRESDLRVLQSAIQQFYADKNHYPNDLGTILINGSALTSNSGEPAASPSPKTYLSNTPKDPNDPATKYCYSSQKSSNDSTDCFTNPLDSGKCHYYELCAKLENPPANPATCICNASSSNFKVTPL